MSLVGTSEKLTVFPESMGLMIKTWNVHGSSSKVAPLYLGHQSYFAPHGLMPNGSGVEVLAFTTISASANGMAEGSARYLLAGGWRT